MMERDTTALIQRHSEIMTILANGQQIDTAAEARAVARLADAWAKHCERYCSDETYDMELWETSRDNIKSKLDGILGKYGLTARLDGDPRGYVVIILPSAPGREVMPRNCWGSNNGYGVA